MLAEAESLSGDLYDSGGAQLSDISAELYLLGYLLNKPAEFADVAGAVGSNDFFDPWHRRIFDGIERAWTAGENITADAIINALGGDPSAKMLGDLTVGRFIAQLVAKADLTIDAPSIAEHIAACAERRAIGAADDIYVPFQSKFGGQRWSEIGAAGSPQYEWIVENLIPKGETVLIFGDSGTGKSFSTFDMAVHIARGRKFYGRNVDQGLVVYVAAEGGKGFSKRKQAYAIYHGLTDEELPFYLLTRRPDFFSSDVDVDALIAEITAICRLYNVPLALIVLDTLSALTPGMNENASGDVSRVKQRLQKLVDTFGVSAAFVHHTAKGGTTPRGHGSLTADFETTIQFTTTDLKSADGLPVHRAQTGKEREAEKGKGWEFCLPVVSVGKNKWGNDETSCVAVPFDGAKKIYAYGFKANKTELQFLQALFDALNEKGVTPPPSLGLPVSITKAVSIAEVRARMKERYIALHEDSTKADNAFRAAFKRAGDALKAGAVIGYRAELFWYSGKPVHGLNAKLEEQQ
jgi:hypothetical protein